NVFYEFDADSLVAVCHALEDIALEEANGSLIATIQEFSWLETQRERYEQLALTLDEVEVIGTGTIPKRIARLALRSDKKGALKKYRSMTYMGSRVQVAFVAKQTNDAKDFEGRRFTGFYTFEPRLVSRLRADVIREFARQRAIYDAGREIQRELATQREALAKAVRRLRLDGDGYRTREFVSELEKGLSRLVQWKNKMPKLIEQVEGN
ncbi:MAG TPA: DICT sensory domain-containing protein, partial [Verrucomicrobiae bacterium]|nr:DICT sensory domain-containing protein [Verrucomicrobiae bacterium]